MNRPSPVAGREVVLMRHPRIRRAVLALAALLVAADLEPGDVVCINRAPSDAR